MIRRLALTVIALTAGAALAVAPPSVRGRGVVAADHPAASEAGAEMLRRGGNAVDAVVAAALSAGVVQPAGSGLGGGGFGIVADASGSRRFLDFREVAPASATRDMFATGDKTASTVGGRAVAVPSESRGLARMLACCGSLPPSVVAGPAIRQAADGFPVGPHLAASLARAPETVVRGLFPLHPGVPADGDRVRRPELARTLQRWARTAGEDLATGKGAAAIAQAVTGGVTAADLAGYEIVEREPLVGTYRGWTVITAPPPSSGGVILLQMLAVLESFDPTLAQDPPVLGLGSSEYIHLLTEIMKHSYADRAHHLGDPGFVDVPVERLLSPARIAEIRGKVAMDRTHPPDFYGSPIAPPVDAGTQHIAALDARGGAAGITTTINTSFGSGVIVPSLGIVLNNQMDDFAAVPGVPNAYGLVGSEANAIAPGKRPLSSMTPTILVDPTGKVAVSVGGSGGSFIPSAVLEVVVAMVDFGLDPQEAVALPRFHHQWMPDQLMVEPGTPADVVAALRARGHAVVIREGFSAVQAVRLDGDTRIGGSDPRKDGRPAAAW